MNPEDPARSILQAREVWELNTEPAPRERRQGKRDLIDEFRQFGNAIAILKWIDVCEISKIETLRPHEGAATALLEFLILLADQNQITLFGNATAYHPDDQIPGLAVLTQEQLEKWYEKHGFHLYTGKNGVVEIWYPKRPLR